MIRLIALLVIVSSSFFFLFWLVFAFLDTGDPLIGELLALIASIAIGWYFWKSSAAGPANTLRYMTLGAVLTGSIGFAAGFFGPMIFTPGANQGPMLGIFITGPAGFALGAIGGLIYAKTR